MKSQGVYTEVEDNNQPCVSTWWAISKKLVEGKPITKVRLCIRGFEEIQNFQTDSPCCSRIGIWSALSVLTFNKWCLKSADVETVFHQRKKNEREVYIWPPKEANTSKIWMLQKCVYSLADASRYWYLQGKEELFKLGASISPTDLGIFFWTEINTLESILISHSLWW